MGMCDSVYCEFDLPGDAPAVVKEPGHEFQTKDFEQNRHQLRITREGQLQIKRFSPDGGYVVEFEDLNFTGDWVFYTTISDNWVQFIVYTDHGRLMHIRNISEHGAWADIRMNEAGRLNTDPDEEQS